MCFVCVLIDLDVLCFNYCLVCEFGGGCKILVVIKVDVYGYGVVVCVCVLQDEVVDVFGVVCIEEVLELCEVGIIILIVLLEGFFDVDELLLIVQYDLWFVVVVFWQVDVVVVFQIMVMLSIWLKLDSGMYWLGLLLADFWVVYVCFGVLLQVGLMVLMSYMVCVDELDSLCICEQVVVFVVVIEGFVGEISLCNLFVLLGWLDVCSDWVCLGLMLYGVNLLLVVLMVIECLCLVMMMELKIFVECWIEVGELVGYGVCFVVEECMWVGVVVLGYVDGYLQFVFNGILVQIDGQFGWVIGWVLMDMLIVDFIDLLQVGIGSIVILWGVLLWLDVLVLLCGVSVYQLLCGVKCVLCCFLYV